MIARLALPLAAALLMAACAQTGTLPAGPATADTPLPVPQLKLFEHWVGGRWVGEFEAGGRKFTTVRTYEWSFDRRMIVGRSFGLRDGKLLQSRETPYLWNADRPDRLDESIERRVGNGGEVVSRRAGHA